MLTFTVKIYMQNFKLNRYFTLMEHLNANSETKELEMENLIFQLALQLMLKIALLWSIKIIIVYKFSHVPEILLPNLDHMERK